MGLRLSPTPAAEVTGRQILRKADEGFVLEFAQKIYTELDACKAVGLVSGIWGVGRKGSRLPPPTAWGSTNSSLPAGVGELKKNLACQTGTIHPLDLCNKTAGRKKCGENAEKKCKKR